MRFTTMVAVSQCLHLFTSLLLAAETATAPAAGTSLTIPVAEPQPQTATQPATAESPPSPPATRPAETTEVPFGLKSKTMSGDWFGLGPAMRDLGIGANFFWQSHFFSNLAGGEETGGPKHSATYDLFLTFDLGKMGLIPDADMLVHARQQWGRGVNPWIGPPTAKTVRTRTSAQQVNDDSDYDQTLYVDQLWYRQHFLERKIALQVGYLDFQTIVDKNAFANSEDRQFMNEAFDNNPLFPTASATGLGAALYVNPCEWYSLIVGAADAQRLPLYKPGFSTTFHDEAWFLAWIENTFTVRIPSPQGPLVGNYRFGTSFDPIPRTRFMTPDLPPEKDGDHWNFYMSHDQVIFRESTAGNQGLGLFFRYAYNDSGTYRYNQFWSVGAAYTGLIESRDADTLGFAVGQLMSSPAYIRWRDRRAGEETIYELYYAITVTPWLVITPDIQYIDNPAGSDADDVAHAIAAGVRIRVTF